jgi:hypothetical protein
MVLGDNVILGGSDATFAFSACLAATDTSDSLLRLQKKKNPIKKITTASQNEGRSNAAWRSTVTLRQCTMGTVPSIGKIVNFVISW